jgi:general secretion pathway protein H
MRKTVQTGQTGFTLLELLVVIFIIGMIMTFAALSVGGGSDRVVEQEAKRLTALLRLAGDESIMNSRDMALQLAKTQYAFMAFGLDGQLVPIEEDDTTFRPRELPDDVMFKEAEIGGESVTLSVDPDSDEEPPKIFILSSGEMSPFTLQLGRDDGPDYEVIGDFAGRIEYQRVEQ